MKTKLTCLIRKIKISITRSENYTGQKLRVAKCPPVISLGDENSTRQNFMSQKFLSETTGITNYVIF